MNTTTTTRTWVQLRINDWFICPASGLPERVHSRGLRTNGRVFIRTNHHDHTANRTDRVTLHDRVTEVAARHA
jgi:hypothetical protein